MDNLIFAFNAIAPIILTIVLGYVLKRCGLLSEQFLKIGNKLVFNVSLPCMLFINVYSIESLETIDTDLIAYACIATLIIFCFGILIAFFTTKEPKKRGVMLQCVFRSNYAIIGLPLAQQLGGEKALQVASVLSAVSIPLFNMLAVIALLMFLETGNIWNQIRRVFINILKNPLIIGVFAGVVAVFLRSIIPLNAYGEAVFSLKNDLPFLHTSIKYLSNLTTPLALIILGGRFDFSSTKDNLKEIIIAVTARVIIVPTLAIGVAVYLSEYVNFLSIGRNAYPAMVALYASPVAVASAIMAEQMKNDGKLAGQLVVWTSLISIFTIFFVVVILRSMNLL
ncbi:MAG: AEC family transporter [Lachnospiraceae bacterium]|nr:AEC family transporter [Lachnospiraceae bacterium]